MKFLLVAPRFVKKVGEYYIFPLGLAYVSAALKAAGYTVHCLNLNHLQGTPEEELERAIREIDPDVMATGALSVHYNIIKPMLDTARRVKPTIINILGNGVVSSQPELILTATECDIGVMGEGEVTIVDLADALTTGRDLSTVQGIAFKNFEGKVVRTLERKTNKNLDDITWPDYDGFDFKTHLDYQRTTDDYFFNFADEARAIEFVSSRSCPYACTFCYHPTGRVYRARSLDNVFEELEYVINKYDVRSVAILDELFAVKRERVLEFCSRIKKYNLKWMVQLRVDNVDAEILDAMQDAGCIYISYGLESMSPAVLKSMLKKAKAERTELALNQTYDRQIGIQGNFIFGDPAETWETASETLTWWGNNRRYQAWLCAVQCYPGTKIYHEAVAKNIIPDEVAYLEAGCPPVNITSMDQESWSKLTHHIHLMNSTMLIPGKDLVIEGDDIVDQRRGQLYRMHCTCPHCGHRMTYGRMPFDRIPYGRSTFRLTCRSCFQRYDLPFAFIRQDFGEEINVQMQVVHEALGSNDERRAMRLLNKVLEAAPDHTVAWYWAGLLMLKHNEIDSARAYLENALRQNPFDPEYHIHYADALAGQGDILLASLHYRQALILDPVHGEAMDRIAALNARTG